MEIVNMIIQEPILTVDETITNSSYVLQCTQSVNIQHRCTRTIGASMACSKWHLGSIRIIIFVKQHIGEVQWHDLGAPWQVEESVMHKTLAEYHECRTASKNDFSVHPIIILFQRVQPGLKDGESGEVREDGAAPNRDCLDREDEIQQLRRLHIHPVAQRPPFLEREGRWRCVSSRAWSRRSSRAGGVGDEEGAAGGDAMPALADGAAAENGRRIEVDEYLGEGVVAKIVYATT